MAIIMVTKNKHWSNLKDKGDIFKYEEKEILENEINFIGSSLTESLFDEKLF